MAGKPPFWIAWLGATALAVAGFITFAYSEFPTYREFQFLVEHLKTIECKIDQLRGYEGTCK